MKGDGSPMERRNRESLWPNSVDSMVAGGGIEPPTLGL